LMSVPPATEMFQFAGFASRPYEFRSRYPLRGGFPHSEIPGSPIARISPGLFAACHVLHRLSVPRHPPDALVSRLINRIAVTGDAAPPPRTEPNPSRKPTGPNPCLSRNRGKRRSRMKTLLSDIPQSQPCWRHPPQAKLGFAGKGGPHTLAPGLSASVTSLLSLHPSISPAALRPRRVSPIFSEPRSPSAGACRAKRWFAGSASRRSFAVPVVEVNGFEPMTSCLQSRRSPS
jgi:hypothetical protein